MDRRDLSIFQIGLLFLENCAINALPFLIPLAHSVDAKLYGGLKFSKQTE